MSSMKRQKGMTLKDELPRSVGSQYATGDQWRNNSRKNEERGAKAVVNVTGDGCKVQCCKEQYCIGTWNVRPMNQDKLEVVKWEMATHSSVLDWRIPGMAEPGGLLSMGSHRVGHD